MNLISNYNFSIQKFVFFIEINWCFNLLYLKNHVKFNSIYIDSSLYFINGEFSSILLGSESDYGDLIDFLSSILKNEKNEILLKSNSAKLSRINYSLDLKVLSNNNSSLSIEIDNEFLNTIEKLKEEISYDFTRMSKEISLIEKLTV